MRAIREVHATAQNTDFGFDKLRSTIRSACARLGRVSFQLMLFLCVLITGCSKDGIDRISVSGQVTYDGKRLPWGQIRFIPTGEHAGPVWSALVRDGKYATEGKGVPMGTLRVEITALRGLKTGGVPNLGRNSNPDEASEPLEQYLPEKYHTQSELSLIIPAASGPVEQDFLLTSK